MYLILVNGKSSQEDCENTFVLFCCTKNVMFLVMRKINLWKEKIRKIL